jgi:hypothetical protein
MECPGWLMKMVSIILGALVAIPSAHPPFALSVFDVADVELSVRV